MAIQVQEFFDKDTFTLSYVVYDPANKDALILDSVWDYEPASSQMSTHSLQKIITFISDHRLHVHYILETHAHADHVSGSQKLKEIYPQARVGIGAHITQVQETFKKIYNLKSDFKVDGSQFDVLLQEEKTYDAGSLLVQVFHTPGHTPACCCYLIGDHLFTGDLLFMPDFGTGRCDFPDGCAKDLYHSIQKIYRLPDDTRVYTGHDYMPNGRPLKFTSTIGEQKRQNTHIKADTPEQDFVAFRTARDKSLSAPRLLLPSVQINIDAGRLPPAETNGQHYLKIPLLT